MIARLRHRLLSWAASTLADEARRQDEARRASKLEQLRADTAAGRISRIPPRDIVVAGVRERRAAHAR